MEIAFKKVVQERAQLSLENKNLYDKLLLVNQSERKGKTELHDLYTQFKKYQDDYGKLKKKYQGLKQKYEEVKNNREEIRHELELALHECDLRMKQVKDRDEQLDRQLRDKIADDHVSARMLAKLEKEVEDKEELIILLRQQMQSGYVSTKEYERLNIQYEKLCTQCQEHMVPLDQYNNVQNELSRLQDVISESVTRKEYRAALSESQELQQKVTSNYVTRESFEELLAKYDRLKTCVEQEYVQVSRWNELVAQYRRLRQRMEEDCVDVTRYHQLEAEIEAALLDRGLLEESARVLQEERDAAVEKMQEKSRELSSTQARLVRTEKEYSALSARVGEGDSLENQLKSNIDLIHEEVNKLSRRNGILEAEKANLMMHLGNSKLKVKHVNESKLQLQRRLEEIETEHRRLQSRLASCERNRADTEEKYKVLEGIVAEYKRILTTKQQRGTPDSGQKQRKQHAEEASEEDYILPSTISIPTSPLRPTYLTTLSAQKVKNEARKLSGRQEGGEVQRVDLQETFSIFNSIDPDTSTY